jgi:proteic killer suppression protein
MPPRDRGRDAERPSLASRHTENRDSVYWGMIKSFGDRRTQRLFEDQVVREFHEIARPAKRKLEMLDAAVRLDVLRVPPANRLEKLRGDLEGFYSIRINDQWRVIFQWVEGHAYAVQIVDYH